MAMTQQKALSKVFGDPQKKILKRLEKRVAVINGLSEKYEKLSDEELQAQTEVLKKRLTKKNVTLDTILPDAFAVVREAAKRVIGERPYDVQLIGGMALHEGNVAEMKTGEGKTLVATLPTYLNALEGKGVHVVTVNDYLAQRDAGWMGQVYDFLGLTTGVIINECANSAQLRVKRPTRRTSPMAPTTSLALTIYATTWWMTWICSGSAS